RAPDLRSWSRSIDQGLLRSGIEDRLATERWPGVATRVGEDLDIRVVYDMEKVRLKTPHGWQQGTGAPVRMTVVAPTFEAAVRDTLTMPTLLPLDQREVRVSVELSFPPEGEGPRLYF